MRRIGMRFCACIVLVSFGCLFWTVRETGQSALPVGPSVIPEDNSHKLLKRAQQLAFLHNWPAAGLLFQHAEKGFEHEGDERDRLYARVGRIRGLVETGSLPDASDELSQILESAPARNDLELRLFCLTAKGDIDFQINPQSSRRVWEAVSKLAASLGNAIWENRARAELGTLAFYNGEIFRAMHLVGRSYLEAKRQHDSAEIARNLAALGEGFAEFGHYEDSLRFFEKAIQQAQATAGAEIPFTAYLGKARMLIALNRSSAGKKMLDAILSEACEKHMQVREARVRLVLGDLARSEGNVFEAITHFQKAANIAQNQHLYRMLGAADSKLAVLYAEREKGDAAIESALAGAQAAQLGSDVYHLPQLLTVLAEQKIGCGDFQSAESIYERALSLIDELLVNVPTFQDKNVLVGTMSSVYRSYVEFAANQLRDPKKSFQVLEQARGRGIADFLRSVASEGREATFRSGISDADGLVQSFLRPIHLGLRFENNPTKREELQWSLWEQEKTTVIAGDRDRWTGLAHARPVSLSAFQATLSSNELALEFSLGEPQSIVLVIDRESISARSLIGGERLKTLVEKYQADVLRGGSGSHQARELYELLLAPDQRKLSSSRLLIIPDGCLQSFPFEALLDSDRHPILESHVISYAPSATVEYWLRSKSSQAGHASFLFLGDVQYETDTAVEDGHLAVFGPNLNRGLFDAEAAPNFRRLPGSRDEIMELTAMVGQRSRMLLGRDATEVSLKAEPLSEYRVLHFATHGVVNLEFPDRSALILGDGPSSPEDGLLQAREIVRLPLNADLVTISACDMAIGKPEGEAGNASIVQSFLFAGARSVVASLWKVNDNFTSFLMRRFYRHLLEGEDKASALRQAKLELIHEFGPTAIPLHWAGFEIFGDGGGSLKTSRGNI